MRSIFTIGVFLMAVLLLVQGTPSDTAAAARSPIDFDAIDAQLQAAMKLTSSSPVRQQCG